MEHAGRHHQHPRERRTPPPARGEGSRHLAEGSGHLAMTGFLFVLSTNQNPRTTFFFVFCPLGVPDWASKSGGQQCSRDCSRPSWCSWTPSARTPPSRARSQVRLDARACATSWRACACACACRSLALAATPGTVRCEGLAARGVVRTVPAAAEPCATAAQRETFRRAARVLPLRFHPNSARSSRPPARVCRALLHAHGLQPFQVGLHPAGNDGRKRVYAA